MSKKFIKFRNEIEAIKKATPPETISTTSSFFYCELKLKHDAFVANWATTCRHFAFETKSEDEKTIP